jgi:hypothetical protein
MDGDLLQAYQVHELLDKWISQEKTPRILNWGLFINRIATLSGSHAKFPTFLCEYFVLGEVAFIFEWIHSTRIQPHLFL